MGLATFDLEVGILCDFLYSVLLSNAILGLDASGLALHIAGGNPFIYGRGGEEVLYFWHHGVDPAVVAGPTSVRAGDGRPPWRILRWWSPWGWGGGGGSSERAVMAGAARRLRVHWPPGSRC
jgi:hypothetical protein